MAHVGVLTLELHLPAPNSLKEKRRILKSIKDRIRTRFNVSIAEISELDKWQKAGLGVSIIGNEKNHLNQTLQGILSFLEGIRDIQIVDYQIEFS